MRVSVSRLGYGGEAGKKGAEALGVEDEGRL